MTSQAPTSTGTPSGVVVTALLGLGAGMLLLAAVPGIARDGEGTGASVALLVAVLLLGLAALLWALASLRRGAVLLARTVVAASFVTTALGVLAYTVAQPLLLLALPGVRLPGADDYATAALLLLSAFGVVLTTRRAAALEPTGEAAVPPRAGRRLLALAAGAAVVGALVTPGLAASAAGDYAVPHGEHGSPAAEAATPRPQASYLDPERSGRPPVVQVHGNH